MSPIFVRPVREQLEHDRLIRHLLARFKRKFDVVANFGDEQLASFKLGSNTFYPDLTLSEDHKLAAVVEVETEESVNKLEAMAQWIHFGKSRVPFSLYVPVNAYDTARRLCEAHRVAVTEIWTYRGAMDAFDLVRMFHDPNAGKGRARRSKAAAGKVSKAARPAKAPAKKRPAAAVKKSKAASKSAKTTKAASPRKKASAPRSTKKAVKATKAGARKK